jgi:exosome complex component RRP4
MTEETAREIVIPGEVLESGEDLLPGEGTRREGKEILASRFGLKEKQGRLVKIIPLSGVYIPRRGNLVIGVINDINFNGWNIDINAPYSSFLSLSECPRFFDKEDLSEYFDIGDMIACKVKSVKRKGVDLTLKSVGLGKVEDGMILYINSNKVPRVIGKEGSMIKIIKDATGCDITVGQNGVVWIKGKNADEELLAKEAILFITGKSFVSGLTDKVKEFIDNKIKEKK